MHPIGLIDQPVCCTSTFDPEKESNLQCSILRADGEHSGDTAIQLDEGTDGVRDGSYIDDDAPVQLNGESKDLITATTQEPEER